MMWSLFLCVSCAAAVRVAMNREDIFGVFGDPAELESFASAGTETDPRLVSN